MTARTDATAHVVDATTGEELLSLDMQGDRVEYAPDGARIVSYGLSGSVRAWDAETGALISTWMERSMRTLALEWSPDGRHAATLTQNRAVQIWDAETGELVSTLQLREASRPNGVQFSPDGARLVTRGDDGTVKLWDPATGALTLDLRDRVVLRRPDGSTQWPIPPATLTAIGCERLRTFPDEYVAAADICEAWASPR